MRAARDRFPLTSELCPKNSRFKTRGTAKVEIRSTTIKSFNRQTRLLKRKSSRNRAPFLLLRNFNISGKTILVHFNMFSVWIVHTEDNIYFSTPGALFVSLVRISNGLEQKLYDQPNYLQAFILCRLFFIITFFL